MTFPTLREIAQNLARVIPAPMLPRVKQQKSWAGLKVGQTVQIREGETVYTPEVGHCHPGAVFKVVEATSQGATLKLLQLGDKLEVLDDRLLNLTNREWHLTFEVVRKRGGTS